VVTSAVAGEAALARLTKARSAGIGLRQTTQIEETEYLISI